jgi:S1-C subfamily serine protease
MARAAGVDQAYGVWVAAMEPGGPAARAGLAEGDLIIAAEGRAITGLDDLLRVLDHTSIDRPTRFDIIRAGRKLTVTVTPKARKRG